MSQLFISDLHLMQARPDITGAFLDFLEYHTAHTEALYILGDFFEVWLGDDDASPFNRSIIEAVAAVSAPKYFMHGNRDFLIGEAACNAMGATLLDEETVIDLYGRPALLMHGDTLCTADTAYMAARKMLRDPVFQADFLSKSIPERVAFAEGARQQSKAHTRESTADIMDVTQAEVRRVMNTHRVDLLIHGHTHRPRIHQLDLDSNPAERIVLGDWDTRGWYLEADERGYRLENFTI
ncbi:MAG: UDP-2,3-diacylglucosamine diphosphatase [Pseudomonadales bacterium]